MENRQGNGISPSLPVNSFIVFKGTTHGEFLFVTPSFTLTVEQSDSILFNGPRTSTVSKTKRITPHLLRPLYRLCKSVDCELVQSPITVQRWGKVYKMSVPNSAETIWLQHLDHTQSSGETGNNFLATPAYGESYFSSLLVCLFVC